MSRGAQPPSSTAAEVPRAGLSIGARNRQVESIALTRQELAELLETIATEVVREMGSSPGGAKPAAAPQPAAKAESCGLEVCPHNPRPVEVEARTISMTDDLRKLAALFDHTLLRPEATRGEVEKLCQEARQL